VSAEWVWQTDAEHRLVGLVTNLPHMKKIGTTRVGTRRWEQVNARALSCGWEDHIADLEARREFCVRVRGQRLRLARQRLAPASIRAADSLVIAAPVSTSRPGSARRSA